VLNTLFDINGACIGDPFIGICWLLLLLLLLLFPFIDAFESIDDGEDGEFVIIEEGGCGGVFDEYEDEYI